MTSKRFTLFELHLDDALVAPGAHFHDDDPRDEAEEVNEAGEGGGFRRFLGLFAMSVVFSIAVTVLVRRLAGGDEETDAEPIPIDENAKTKTSDA